MLNEPFKNLDPQGCVELTKILQEKAKAGTAFILEFSSFNTLLDLCDRVLVVNNNMCSVCWKRRIFRRRKYFLCWLTVHKQGVVEMYKILIVEDEPWISTLLRSILEEGVSTAEVIGEAINGRQALTMIAELQPDIVLTDINLPILSGLQVIAQARESGFSGKFVVISGYNEFSYVQQALCFGVEDYLLKPIDDEEVCRLVASLRRNWMILL